jgi:hypothetical protein
MTKKWTLEVTRGVKTGIKFAQVNTNMSMCYSISTSGMLAEKPKHEESRAVMSGRDPQRFYQGTPSIEYW